MPRRRAVNSELKAAIAAAGVTHEQLARAVVRVAVECGAGELTTVGRSHVSHWVAGSVPSGRGPQILGEALSRFLRRPVGPEDLGLRPPAEDELLSWQTDTVTALIDLGRAAVDLDRRQVLGAAVYSLAALAVPGDDWWAEAIRTGQARAGAAGHRVGAGDLDAVQDMVRLFSEVDQRRGGGHARTAVVQYLSSDVARLLRGRFTSDALRRDLFTAAAELAYLAGWMAFDDAEHAAAQRHFTVATKLAAEADDPPMQAHILRAMAHQALDLGHPRYAHELAAASVHGDRYTLASPRERALIGVVYGRTLAASGEPRRAAQALLRAEDDLARAGGDREPARVFFFGPASLAHETACTLRDSGDLTAAADHFRRSVRLRPATAFARTHAVTLGYLGEVQARTGQIETACATWSQALDSMDGVRSGRTRAVARTMRVLLSPYRGQPIRGARTINTRARRYLDA